MQVGRVGYVCSPEEGKGFFFRRKLDHSSFISFGSTPVKVYFLMLA